MVIISLLPDIGHITPLLRIAAVIEQTEDVSAAVVIAPEEASRISELLPPSYRFRSLGTVMPADYRGVLAHWANAPRSLRRVFFDGWMERRYFTPLAFNGYGKIEYLASLCAEEKPTLLISDEHMFASAYRKVATIVQAPLIINRACGSYYPDQVAAGEPWQRRGHLAAVSERISRRLLSNLVSKFWQVVRPNEDRAYRHMLVELHKHWNDAASSAVHGAARVTQVSFGSGPFETNITGNHEFVRGPVRQYAPLPSFVPREVEPEAARWVAQSPEPVAVVSFGTLATDVRFPFRAFANWVNEAGYRLLIASPTRPELDDRRYGSRVLWTKWIDQAALLKASTVKLFFTHAGSGAVQDAMHGGVPMVCIPVDWDQPYNAHVVESLGLGVTLKRRLTRRNVLRAIENAERCAPNARAHQETMRSMEPEQALGQLVSGILGRVQGAADIKSSCVSVNQGRR